MKKSSARDTILEAAERVAAHDGIGQLSLDAVAQEAGVSKGGLLYHFPSKSALIAGMIAAQVGQWEKDYQTFLAEEADSPGRHARAYLRSSLVDLPDAAQIGLLAAAVNEPALLEAPRAFFRQRQAELENDGIDPALATVIRLALDGWWITALLGLCPPTKDRQTAVRDCLTRLTHEREGGR